MIDKLMFVTVNDRTYLGELEESKNRIVLRNCLGVSRITRDTINRWIKHHNLNLLETITLTGAASYHTRTLDRDEICILRRAWEDMQDIKNTAIARLENGYFTEDQK